MGFATLADIVQTIPVPGRIFHVSYPVLNIDRALVFTVIFLIPRSIDILTALLVCIWRCLGFMEES